MAIRFAPSAFRHGIDEDRARDVIEQCPDPIYEPDAIHSGADRVLFLGPDRRGIPIEVLAIELPNGELVVFHAMRLRSRYRDDYHRVMEWHSGP